MTEIARHHSTHDHLTKRREVAMASIALSVLIVAGYEVGQGLQSKPVGTKTVYIEPGDTGAIEAIDRGIDEIAASHGIDPSAIPDSQITYAGQDVTRQQKEITGVDIIQLDAGIRVTLRQDDFGDLSVTATLVTPDQSAK